MIINKDIIADLHIHTIGSMHAYSTVKECIDCAKKRGLKYIAITDHYYDCGSELDKKNEVNRIINLERQVSSTRSGVKVIGGAEFNLSQDIPSWDKLKVLKWKLIGAHGWFFDRKSTTLDVLYDYYNKAADDFDGFSHIEREIEKINNKFYAGNITDKVKTFFNNIIIMSKEKNIILELNESSLRKHNDAMIQKIMYWLQTAKENGNVISLGTDAHYCEEIGDFNMSIDILNEIKFPKDRIINCNEDLIKEKLRI